VSGEGTWKGRLAYAFDSAEPLKFDQDGVVFQGRRGGVVVDDTNRTVRLVMLDGERIGRGSSQALGLQDGPST